MDPESGAPHGEGAAPLEATTVRDDGAMSGGIYGTPAIAAAANRKNRRYRILRIQSRRLEHATSPYRTKIPARGNEQLIREQLCIGRLAAHRSGRPAQKRVT